MELEKIDTTTTAGKAEVTQLTVDQCLAIYHAVSRANITRDVKTAATKVRIVREASELAGRDE